MRSALLLLALSAAAVPVAAQEKSMQHKEDMGEMMGGFGILKALLPFTPEALLKHGDHRKLTPDQVAR